MPRRAPASASDRSRSAMPASRWGSCSASGAIRYNWRLILAPPHLLRWVVAHEVAHRRHMNHGPAFQALEAELYGGDVAAARAELRRARAAAEAGRPGALTAAGGGGGARGWAGAGCGRFSGLRPQHFVQPLLVDLRPPSRVAAGAAGASGSAGCAADRIAVGIDQRRGFVDSSCPTLPRRAPAASRAAAPGFRTARPGAWPPRPS